MLNLYLRVSIVSLIALIPSILSVVLLWYFEALDKGGPLIIVLLVPAIGWYVTHLIRFAQHRREPRQNGSESDAPPKYERVMAEPPPYDVLYMEKPLPSPTCSYSRPSTISDKLSHATGGAFGGGEGGGGGSVAPTVATFGSMKTETTLIFPTADDTCLDGLSGGSDWLEMEPLVGFCRSESSDADGGGALRGSQVIRHHHADYDEDEGHDPDLPSYQEAVKTLSKV